MNNINKKLCTNDNDCNINELCGYEENNNNEYNNYCIENNLYKLYYGCLDDTINYRENNFEAIESKSMDNNQTYMDCINFVRKQTNKDGIDFNYMIYRDKKKVFVDVSTINIYLKCDEEILAVIPYTDYFNLTCDERQENCVLIGKDSLKNFIKQNTKNCNGKIYLEITYLCENEGLKKTNKIPINLNSDISIKLNMNCPINKKDERYNTKCEALYINNKDDNLKTYMDYNTSLYYCKNPVFKVPKPVKDINIYKRFKNKNLQNEINNYDKQINEKINDVRKLEAEKYMKLKGIQTGNKITFEEALDAISKYPLKENTTNWKIYENYDAAQKLYDYSENKVEILKYYGKVYTIQDAMDAANKNNELFFVWYHNSYELDNFASKLYFIDIYSLDESILKKDNWVKSENVSTGVMKFQLEHFDDDNYDNENLILSTQNDLIYNLMNILSIQSEEEKDNRINEALSKNNDVNDYFIKNLNSKITSIGQAIKMNDYQSGVNDEILKYVYIILGLIITIIILIILFNFVFV